MSKRVALASLLAVLQCLWSSYSDAQPRSGHIEKVANKRLSGNTIANLPNLSYDECETRCLSDSRCVAIEHFRGGRLLNRKPQCKLFSSVRETRDNRFADIGYRRSGGASAAAKAEKKSAAKKSAAANELEKLEKATQPSGPASPPGNADPTPTPRSSPLDAAGRGRGPATTERSAASPPPPAPPPPPPARAPYRTEQPGGGSSSDFGSLGRSAGAPAPSAPASPPPPPAARAAEAPPPQPAPIAPTTRGPASAPAPVTAAPPPAATSTPPPPSGKSRSIARSGSAREGAAPEPTDWDVVPVFYGTDRNRSDLPKRIAYGSNRARKLEVGRALVTVPKAHQVPNVERPWAIKIPYIDVTLYQESEDPKRHFTIQELKELTKDDMLARVRERLAASVNFKDQALVMIHGYNNGFDDALYRTAQIAYDLKYDGAPFLYSWPSGAGITSYPYDRESAQQAEQYLSRFLLMVLNETGAKSVSLIAHSMGSQPLLQVLRDLRRTNPEISRINQVILAAPDVDRDTFEYLASQITGIGQGITMYVSANDVALGVSRRFAGGIPRAGDVPEGLGPAVVNGVDTIDISGLSTDYFALNHSAYAEKTALLRDIELILRTGQRPPEQRLNLLHRITGDKGVYWRYTK